MARRRYQRGTIFLRGKRKPVWVARWREDILEPGASRAKRVLRSEVLGTRAQFPTKRLAQRELERRLAPVNSPDYRPRTNITFGEFAERWTRTVLLQQKPSTRAATESLLRCHLLPQFSDMSLSAISTEMLQRHLSSANGLSAKTVRNALGILKSMWKTGRAWGYVVHDPFQGLQLPKRCRPTPKLFSLEEIQKILASAKEPQRTLYWLAAETGMRAGELCGLFWEDIVDGRVFVRRSAWHGRLQTPKTEAAVRAFAISPALSRHLESRRGTGLVFRYRNGRPWKGEKVVEYHLGPLCEQLGIPRRGLHAFRHGNATLLVSLGVTPKVVASRLGHTDPHLTLDLYTHLVREDDRRAVEKLAAVLIPSVPKTAVSSPATA